VDIWEEGTSGSDEAYCEDILILRSRMMTIPQIAQELGIGRRQVESLVKRLREQDRWFDLPRDARGAAALAQSKRQERGY